MSHGAARFYDDACAGSPYTVADGSNPWTPLAERLRVGRPPQLTRAAERVAVSLRLVDTAQAWAFGRRSDGKTRELVVHRIVSDDGSPDTVEVECFLRCDEHDLPGAALCRGAVAVLEAAATLHGDEVQDAPW